jgi:hypothetical protein
VNKAGGDLRLATSDFCAIKVGANLYADTSIAVTTDIVGTARPSSGPMDAGAYQVASPDTVTLYRSVGKSPADINTGRTVTIQDGTATFSAAMSNTMGVGDAIQYTVSGASTIAFVSGRTSSTVFTVHDQYGREPPYAPALTAANVYRAFNSLSNWESQNSGNVNASIAAAARYQALYPSTNLVVDRAIGYAATYGDGADTTAVIISGWTTGASNYLKISAPALTTEVGASQRHAGQWDATKYVLSPANASGFDLRADYVKLDGLQVTNTGAFPLISTNGYAWPAGANQIDVSACILKGNGTSDQMGILGSGGNQVLNIWNTLIYNIASISTNSRGMQGQGLTKVYNSTVIGGYYGLVRSAGTLICKNVYAGGSTNGDFVGPSSLTTSASSDNSGSAGLQSIAVSTANFQNVTSGSEDFHLTSCSALKDVGTNTSGDPSPFDFLIDIDGATRSDPWWDIGADESSSGVCDGSNFLQTMIF